jgi:hypothetical protein
MAAPAEAIIPACKITVCSIPPLMTVPRTRLPKVNFAASSISRPGLKAKCSNKFGFFDFASVSPIRACSKSGILALQTPKFYLAGSKEPENRDFYGLLTEKIHNLNRL